ncbi:hypothetical protein H8959_020455 [Pygathrix nigripes]
MTLFLSRHRTVVCKTVAAKLTAQISRTPQGDCVTKQEYWGNGTPVLMDTNAVLCCPPIAFRNLIVIAWEIIIRGQPSCTEAYRKETNETKKANCTDERITWVSIPDQNSDLQIHPVAITNS